MSLLEEWTGGWGRTRWGRERRGWAEPGQPRAEPLLAEGPLHPGPREVVSVSTSARQRWGPAAQVRVRVPNCGWVTCGGGAWCRMCQAGPRRGLRSFLLSLTTLGISKTPGFKFHLNVDGTRTFLPSLDPPCSPSPAPYLRLKLSVIETSSSESLPKGARLLQRRPAGLGVNGHSSLSHTHKHTHGHTHTTG